MLNTGNRYPWLRIFRRVTLAVLVSIFLWTVVLRPISPRVGPVPAIINDGWQVTAPINEGFDGDALHKTIEALLDAPLNVHGVLVERHGNLVAEYYQGGKDRSVYGLISTRRSFGPADIHDIRSIGKSINSLLYGIALQQGKVPPVSAPVLSLYPQVANSATEKKNIRVEDLLNMASGLKWHEGGAGPNDELRLFWKKDIAAYVFSHEVEQAPDTAFNYNGGGTAILSDLITRGSGQSLDAFARENLFVPLGIRNWQWVEDVNGRPMAFNGLRMRPRDLLKIGRLVANKGRWNGRQIIPESWIATSMTPKFDTDVRDYRYAYQWWSGEVTWEGRKLAWHGGFGNGGQRLYIIPDLDVVIVTSAGAYDEDATAIRVNDLVQQIVDNVKP